MNEYDPYLEQGPSEERFRDDLYRQHPKLGKAYDYLMASGQDDSNWRRIMHEMHPKITGQEMLDVAEAEKDATERALFRRFVLIYRAEISSAVKKAIENGEIPASAGAAKLEEIFNKPLIPEGEEIIV